MDDDVLAILPGQHQLHEVTPSGGQAVAVGDVRIVNSDSGVHVLVIDVFFKLSEGVSALRTTDFAYSFTCPNQPGTYYCLILEPDTPAESIALLQHVLQACCAYHHVHTPISIPASEGEDGSPLAEREAQPVEVEAGPDGVVVADKAQKPAHPVDKLAAGIAAGGQAVGGAIVGITAWATSGLQKGTAAAVARMQPAAQPATISPEMQARLDGVRNLAQRTAAFSGHVAERALAGTAQIAGSIASKVAASTGIGKNLQGNSTAEGWHQTPPRDGVATPGARKVAGASLDAVEAVYDSLADAARLVMAHTKSAAATIVGHKYGQQAALATHTGMDAVSGAVETGLNVYKLRPTALAKKVVKETVKQTAVEVSGVRKGEAAAAAAALPAGQAAISMTAPPPAITPANSVADPVAAAPAPAAPTAAVPSPTHLEPQPAPSPAIAVAGPVPYSTTVGPPAAPPAPAYAYPAAAAPSYYQAAPAPSYGQPSAPAPYYPQGQVPAYAAAGAPPPYAPAPGAAGAWPAPQAPAAAGHHLPYPSGPAPPPHYYPAVPK